MSKLKGNTPISNLAAKFLSKLPFLKDKYANHERQLADHLKVLKDQQLIDSEVFSMLVGVTTVAKLQVRDIMVPRSQMVVLDRDDSIEELTREIIDSGHSRFPVIGEDKDEVIGIFLAKLL